ncbi:MAG TPA: PEGA domain-containing protein [Polyangiaceae bacterium]|nr:PEGA domain-containing protein [Polyangiaceae bacterium]
MPAAAEDAAVEALIQRGIQLRRDSADEEALNVFLEAEKQDPRSVRVLLHIVTAAQAAGKWLVADAYMKKVSALENDPYYRRHADAIDVVRRAVAARVGTFQAQGEPDGASVRLDGQIIGTLPMKDPVSIEAGAYVMEVEKPGFYRLRRNVSITGGVLTREPVELNRAQARADLAAGGGAAGAAEGPPPEPAWWQAPAVGWTMVGVGLASGITSGIAFAVRQDRVEQWNSDSCIPSNEPSATREEQCGNYRDEAKTAETVGIITGITGAVITTLGVVQLLSLDPAEPTEDSAQGGLRVTSCGIGPLSLACQGRF